MTLFVVVAVVIDVDVGDAVLVFEQFIKFLRMLMALLSLLVSSLVACENWILLEGNILLGATIVVELDDCDVIDDNEEQDELSNK